MLRCELFKASLSYAADTTATKFIAGAQLSLSAVEFIAFAFRTSGPAMAWPLFNWAASCIFNLPAAAPGLDGRHCTNSERKFREIDKRRTVETEISFQFFQWASSI
jgi:hypothetical protein